MKRKILSVNFPYLTKFWGKNFLIQHDFTWNCWNCLYWVRTGFHYRDLKWKVIQWNAGNCFWLWISNFQIRTNHTFRPQCIKGKERRLSPPLKITIHFATTTSKTFSDRKKFVLSRIFDGDFTVVCQFSVDDRWNLIKTNLIKIIHLLNTEAIIFTQTHFVIISQPSNKYALWYAILIFG